MAKMHDIFLLTNEWRPFSTTAKILNIHVVHSNFPPNFLYISFHSIDGPMLEMSLIYSYTITKGEQVLFTSEQMKCHVHNIIS